MSKTFFGNLISKPSFVFSEFSSIEIDHYTQHVTSVMYGMTYWICIEHLRYERDCPNQFAFIISFELSKSLSGIGTITSISWMRKLRYREADKGSQGHTDTNLAAMLAFEPPNTVQERVLSTMMTYDIPRLETMIFFPLNLELPE